MAKPTPMFEGSMVVVHLDLSGEIERVQRRTKPRELYSNYPDWLLERVAFIKMTNNPSKLSAIKVQDTYFMVWLTRKEYTQLGKLIRNQDGTNP
jgi:hypothetical protein